MSFGGPPPHDAAALPVPERAAIGLEKQPGWAVGLDAVGGLAAAMGSDTRGAFALGGAMLRARYRYFEVGGYYVASDSPLTMAGSLTEFGGMAGAWLPYTNWVDFELAARLGSRVYEDASSRYGASGFEVSGMTLGFQLGVSDRARSGLLGGRVGAQVVGAYDLKQRDVTWQQVRTDSQGMEVMTSGTTHVGGFTLGIQMSLGLEIGEGP